MIKQPALYCSNDYYTKTQVVPTATSLINIFNIFDYCPKYLFILCVKTEDLANDTTKNPFAFQNMNISEMNLYVNGLLKDGDTKKYNTKNRENSLILANIMKKEYDVSKNKVKLVNLKETTSEHEAPLYSFILKPHLTENYINLKRQEKVSLEI